ncbi:MAG: extracellular solute-binding protein [bacterium]|nr:extracellular solute-binding protein [bacterium]
MKTRLVSLLLAALMVASLIPGFAMAEEVTPAWQKNNAEPIELTWYVNATWWDPSYGQDIVTKKIQADTNITINFMIGDDNNLNTLFAGGDLPDMITLFDSTSLAATSANNWALPLQKLADEYDPYFYQVAAEDTLNWLRLSDGYTYGYPGYSGSERDFDPEYYDIVYPQQAYLMRKDVYEALGEPDMSTPEAFLDTLGKIAEQYPGLTPLGFNAMADSEGALGARFQNLLGVPMLNEDGTWYDRQMDEEYLDWLRVLNQAYRAGYINDDSFSDDGVAFSEKVQIGKYAFIIASGVVNMNPDLQAIYTNDPDAAYVAVEGPASKTGRTPIYSNAGVGGWTITFITNACKDSERAIGLMSYLISDYGEIITFFGIEGETYYIDENGKYILTDEVKEVKNNDPMRYRTEYRMTNFYLFGHDRYNTMGENPTSMDQIYQFGSDKIHAAGLDYIRQQFMLSSINPDANTMESRYLNNITTNWNTTLVSMIRAGSEDDFNTTLNNYKSFRDFNGFEDVVKIYNEKIQQNRVKLGYAE